MKLKNILSVIIFGCSSLFSQELPECIRRSVKEFNLLPLSEVDVSSKKIPKDFTSALGWKVAYYGGNIFSGQIDYFAFIYKNEKCFYEEWKKNYTVGQIIYDSLYVLKETEDFLYTKLISPYDTSSLFVLHSKKGERPENYHFYDPLYVDLDHDLFVEYDGKHCQFSKELYLRATNIKTNEVKEFHFTKGLCEGGNKNWCIDKFTYENGVLTVTATLTKKGKTITETKQVKI